MRVAETDRQDKSIEIAKVLVWLALGALSDNQIIMSECF